jgi:monoamine oxidase
VGGGERVSHSDGYDCVVLGAGVAGLAAARRVAEAGRRVVVLEARERVGGRLLTLYPEGEETPVELGAEFVHGRPAELLALLDEAGLKYYETAGEQMRFEGGVLRRQGEEDGGFFALLEELSERAEDQTFDAFLAARGAPAADARRARQYVEGFNAADASRIGTRGLARQQAAEDAIEGDRAARLSGGYAGLAAYLRGRVEAAGGLVRVGAPVASVGWAAGRASVETVGGERFGGRAVVVALPLGVLQAGSVRFSPEPVEALEAAGKLAAGAVQRLVLRFRERFWAEGMRFLFTADEMPSTWWTTAPHGSGVLTGWVGGPWSLAMDAEGLLRSGLRSLERVFSLGVGALDRELLGWHTHDWQLDPYSLGAYSYAPAGAAGAAAEMAVPVEGTVFFAGEHTDVTGHPGTVHGALRSGLRAGEQVLGVLAG